ncbi:hypothetical protein [Azospirillum sp.]|uniref:hypothetical protein n=1 Tax=Azospirillum sp. TaxID=34012 RepID=UPI00263976B4|nr:hypothetical protein [Azospirillum sp.]
MVAPLVAMAPPPTMKLPPEGRVWADADNAAINRPVRQVVPRAIFRQLFNIISLTVRTNVAFCGPEKNKSPEISRIHPGKHHVMYCAHQRLVFEERRMSNVLLERHGRCDASAFGFELKARPPETGKRRIKTVFHSNIFIQ